MDQIVKVMSDAQKWLKPEVPGWVATEIVALLPLLAAWGITSPLPPLLSEATRFIFRLAYLPVEFRYRLTVSREFRGGVWVFAKKLENSNSRCAKRIAKILQDEIDKSVLTAVFFTTN
jgi:hypothetical protein